MKHVHFFGCSLTAGDELTDHIRFPWKDSNTEIEEYIKKRNAILNSNGEYDQSYAIENKMLAYPAQLEKITDNIKCYNHATNGASQAEMTYRLLKLIYTKQPIDYVFFQLPPTNREAVFNDTEVTSLQYSRPPIENINQSSYIKYKILSFGLYTHTVADLYNLLLVKGTLTARNIPHTFLDMVGRGEDTEPRTILQNYPEYHWMLDHGIELDNPFLYVRKETTLGKHFTLETHIRVAEYLKNKYIL
jgi:hypothetical protein